MRKNKLLTILGLLLTFFYLVLLICLTRSRLHEFWIMDLNEIGDFLAGVFGPLAMVWLILGFLQQGEELQQSTQALKLQAEELNHSVVQQKEMVELTKKQLELEIKELKEQKVKQNIAAQPKIVFNGVGSLCSGSKCSFDTTATNLGFSVTNVRFKFDHEMLQLVPGEISAWQRGQILDIKFEFQGEIPEEPLLSIVYTDGNDLVQEVSFDILVNKLEHPPRLKFAA